MLYEVILDSLSIKVLYNSQLTSSVPPPIMYLSNQVLRHTAVMQQAFLCPPLSGWEAGRRKRRRIMKRKRRSTAGLLLNRTPGVAVEVP